MTVTRRIRRQPAADARKLARMAGHLADLSRLYGLGGHPISPRLAAASAYVKEIAAFIAPKEPHGPPSNR